MEALKSHFAGFSTTFLHRRSPYSPVSALGPGASIGSENGDNAPSPSEELEEVIDEQAPEGDLYSFVPLKSFRRAIVVYYSAEDAERARLESDRLYIPETGKCPAVTLRAFRAPETVLVEEGWFIGSGRNKAISDDGEGILLPDCSYSNWPCSGGRILVFWRIPCSVLNQLRRDRDSGVSLSSPSTDPGTQLLDLATRLSSCGMGPRQRRSTERVATSTRFNGCFGTCQSSVCYPIA
jgi:hypothetical protein